LDAVIDLERQYTLTVFKLLDALTQVETACHSVHELLAANDINTAKQQLFHLLFEGENPIQDDMLDCLTDAWYDGYASELEDV
jgi:hypothetical protein